MSRQLTMIACILVSAVMLSTVTSPAQAGSVTIYNDNCTKTYKGKKVKRVTVTVKGRTGSNCTEETRTIHQGESTTIQLQAKYHPSRTNGGGVRECEYTHKASGVWNGSRNVKGTEHSEVVCKKAKGLFRTCQCKKR